MKLAPNFQTIIMHLTRKENWKQWNFLKQSNCLKFYFYQMNLNEPEEVIFLITMISPQLTEQNTQLQQKLRTKQTLSVQGTDRFKDATTSAMKKKLR